MKAAMRWAIITLVAIQCGLALAMTIVLYKLSY